MAEKMRVHILAKELNVTSKDILAKCRAEEIDLKNHMSTLGPGLEATVREWFSEGAHIHVVEKTAKVDLKKARSKVKKKTKAKSSSTTAGKDSETGTAVAELDDPETTVETESPSVTVKETQSTKAADVAPVKSTAGPEPTAAPEIDEPTADVAAPESEAADATQGAIDVAAEAPVETPAKVEAPVEEAPEEPEEVIQPAGPQNVPAPAKLSGPRVVRYEAPEEYTIPRRGPRRPKSAETGGREADTVVPGDVAGPSDRGGKRRGSKVVEQKSSNRKLSGRRESLHEREVGERLNEWNNQDLAERRARLRGATGRRLVSRRARSKGGGGGRVDAAPITDAQLEEPITAKEFCAALGVPFQRLFPIFQREHGLMLSVMSVIPTEVAELVATELGVELTIVKAKTGMEKVKEEHAAIERKKLERRPPIVTILGHVDHGKTSLLDRIRKARVAAGEDGGITQHISSYHYSVGGTSVTFLDTPGHEAFTAMRARGAQVTDVVVLVVAADDGIMPQTVEAINHAKAAQVPIVVALNKIDLGTQNVTKIYSQLTEHGLTPAGDWGGEIDVVHTSATTGQGVDELVEHLSTLADLHEYKADKTIPAMGIVIEAENRQGAGPVMQVIVRDGTVKVGQVVVCGNAYGKIRSIRDDRGKSVKSAGPSMPVELWGMSEVPSAGDEFYVVENMQRAKTVADEVKSQRVTDARSSVKKARSLEDLVKMRSGADVRELPVIVKADVDGSVDVLVQTLQQFPDNEVRLNVLHGGIGAITDSDIHLADASNAIIIAYRVTVPSSTRKLAEQKNVDVRNYKVIYDVTDDIKKALEGLLTPDEKIESRGSAEVRELFRISKLGLVAGSYVREGVINNKHFARVIRDGVLVRDNCRFESLRRFKDDAKEVRNGMECGIRLQGFDDIKAGDTIETYEIVKIARTLEDAAASAAGSDS
ncbi:MAG: translation initiation factor IF-2 [Phycisphaerales bacterium]|nr:translation initiation factor IF-2 [Phycisphaerales bacterium]